MLRPTIVTVAHASGSSFSTDITTPAILPPVPACSPGTANKSSVPTRATVTAFLPIKVPSSPVLSSPTLMRRGNCDYVSAAIPFCESFVVAIQYCLDRTTASSFPQMERLLSSLNYFGRLPRFFTSNCTDNHRQSSVIANLGLTRTSRGVARCAIAGQL